MSLLSSLLSSHNSQLSLYVQLAGDYLGSSGREVVTVKEGAEPAEFWSALGGKAAYASVSPTVTYSPREPRLFQASTATGSFSVNEVITDYTNNLYASTSITGSTDYCFLQFLFYTDATTT